MIDKANLKDFSLEDLENLLLTNGFSKYRAAQVYSWIFKDIRNFEGMKNLPSSLIEFLNKSFYINKFTLLKKQVSKDGTIKFLFGLKDGNAIECVLMKYKYGYTICISTQVGCKMGCKFCASATGGLIRNLTSGEMLEEVMAVSRVTDKTVSNIVLMGVGEPFDNYSEVMKFVHGANSHYGFNIGMRHITISTSGLVPKIYEFADEKLQCNLAVSLHSAIDSVRSQLMPINKKYNIESLIKACKYYCNKTNRRISFEYALIDGLNDKESDAIALSSLLKNMLCYVNLIPLNYVAGKGLKKSKDREIEIFKNILRKNHVSMTIRRELGQDIDGACGQLRTKAGL